MVQTFFFIDVSFVWVNNIFFFSEWTGVIRVASLYILQSKKQKRTTIVLKFDTPFTTDRAIDISALETRQLRV